MTEFALAHPYLLCLTVTGNIFMICTLASYTVSELSKWAFLYRRGDQLHEKLQMATELKKRSAAGSGEVGRG